MEENKDFTRKAEVHEEAETAENTSAPGATDDALTSQAGDAGSDKEKKEKEKKPIWREILDYAVIIVAAYLIALFVTSFIIINCRIPSGSMETTIMTNDRVIGLRLSYTFGKPKRGDIAVFYAPEAALKVNGREDGTLYIKRVIGLPGDTIEVRDFKVYLNGSEEPLDEPYLDWDNINMNRARYKNFGPYTIPEGEYFMMGDHRDNSSDSRVWGTVPEESIVAKALFIYWPFTHLKWLT